MLKTIIFMYFIPFFIYAQTVDITADNMKLDENTHQIKFIGNAKVVQEKSYIYADTIIVYFNENNETKQYDAIGSVDFEFIKENSHYKGSSDKLTYKPIDTIYILKGHAKIKDIINKRFIKGDIITLNTQTGNAEVKGSRKKPVKFIFETENKK